MRVKTVGDIRELIKNLDDDYTFQLSVNRKVPDEAVNSLSYFCQIDSAHQEGFDVDEISVGDKEVCIRVNVPIDMCERIRTEEYKN